MTKTPHSLKTASEFLNTHLQCYVGLGFLSVSEEPTWGSPTQYDVLLSTLYDPNNYVTLAQLAWRSDEIFRSEFGSRPVKVTNVSFESEHLSRRITVSLDNHRNIPNLTNSARSTFLVRSDVRDFFSEGSSVYAEYERRWKIERAAQQIKTYRNVLKTQMAIEPHVTD